MNYSFGNVLDEDFSLELLVSPLQICLNVLSVVNGATFDLMSEQSRLFPPEGSQRVVRAKLLR